MTLPDFLAVFRSPASSPPARAPDPDRDRVVRRQDEIRASLDELERRLVGPEAPRPRHRAH